MMILLQKTRRRALKKKSNGLLTALMYFAMTTLGYKASDAIWHLPMSQVLLMVRQSKLEADPKTAWTFSDEEFIAKLREAGY